MSKLNFRVSFWIFFSFLSQLFTVVVVVFNARSRCLVHFHKYCPHEYGYVFAARDADGCVVFECM